MKKYINYFLLLGVVLGLGFQGICGMEEGLQGELTTLGKAIAGK